MDKESIYLLQKIDCNCNDCVFMVRDFEKFKKWEEWNRQMQLVEFETSKRKEIADAQAVIDAATDEQLLKSGNGMLRVAQKRTFQFNRDGLISYGTCTKFNKPVSFLPAICQLETQHCFVHRRDEPK